MRKKPNVELIEKEDTFKIYIDGYVHLCFKSDQFSGYQTWLTGTKLYCIEYSLKNDVNILCEYKSEFLWKDILTKLDNHRF